MSASNPDTSFSAFFKESRKSRHFPVSAPPTETPVFRGSGPGDTLGCRPTARASRDGVATLFRDMAVMKTVPMDRAAEILQVSRRTIYNHIRRGYLQTIRTIGGQSQRVTLESLALVQGAGRRRGERVLLSQHPSPTPATANTPGVPTFQAPAPRTATWQAPASPSTS